MPDNPLPHYTFLPWARRGVAAAIDQVDSLGLATPAEPKGRATLTAQVKVATQPVPGQPALAPQSVERKVSILGPVDVRTLKPDAVIRSVPGPGSLDATPGELAFVEFYDEDFPWRYTPARATAGHRLRPWITLLVLAEGEFSLLPRPGETSILVVEDLDAMPLPDETWAWGHVQVSGRLASADELDAVVSATPDHALSRLLSPRRLQEQTSYHAFVVPAFESGRLAGLGTPDQTVPAQRPSWGDGQPARFPAYHDWAFRTGDLSDFEVLARRPQPMVMGDAFGTRRLDVSNPGAGLPRSPGAVVGLEGALQPIRIPAVTPPQPPAGPYPGPASVLVDQLRTLVDLGEDQRSEEVGDDDPIVTPPAYGAAPVGLTRIGDVPAFGSQFLWLDQLNADPRHRVAAGLGARIVRDRDEELMERAWRQVGELEAVNQRLREADLAMAATDRIFAKHLAPSRPDRILRVTAGAHSTIARGGQTSVRGEIDASRVPAAATSPLFRRISRPQRRLVSALAGLEARQMQDGLVYRLNIDPTASGGSITAVSAAPPAPEPIIGVALATVVSAAAASATQLAAQPSRARDVFLRLARDEAAAQLAGPGLTDVTTPTALTSLRQVLTAGVDRAVPPPVDPASAAAILRAGVAEIIAAISALRVTDPGQAIIDVDPVVFAGQFGAGIDGKFLGGIVVAPAGSALRNVASTSDATLTQSIVSALGTLVAVSGDRPPSTAPPGLAPPDDIARAVGARLAPRTAVPERLLATLGGVGALARAELARSRRLKPVLAHPRFDDPLFTSLRALGQDYVLPNVAGLPTESITIMEPNDRFVESLLAGACTEMGRELLWNAFPTDQRGTYFPRFWDARDAGLADPPPDIADLVEWTGGLGTNSTRGGSVLVLVVRAQLLVKFPSTVVFAQAATVVNGERQLDPAGDVRYPILRGRLEPDIELYGFDLSPAKARGAGSDAGYFFCFMERPGQARFGLDVVAAPALATWDDLAWAHLVPTGTEQVEVVANAALAPSTTGLAAWGETSAHLASILSQSPVFLARHATDMLPPVRP